jgi:hypothetical protein
MAKDSLVLNILLALLWHNDLNGAASNTIPSGKTHDTTSGEARTRKLSDLTLCCLSTAGHCVLRKTAQAVLGIGARTFGVKRQLTFEGSLLSLCRPPVIACLANTPQSEDSPWLQTLQRQRLAVAWAATPTLTAPHQSASSMHGQNFVLHCGGTSCRSEDRVELGVP